MKNNLWYDVFVESLREKFPKKSTLIVELMNLLSLEREAVYRRLRKDVLFSFHEIATIAYAWNMSLDDIVHCAPGGDPAFKLKMLRCVEPTAKDLQIMQGFINTMALLADDPKAEYIEVCNVLPLVLLIKFPDIIKFYTLAWKYRYRGENNVDSLSQTKLSAKMMDLEEEHFRRLTNIPNTYFIWDAHIIHYLISDINYYASIYRITPEETKLLKKELHGFVNYMEDLSQKGSFPETNNKIHLYILNTNVDTGYACYYSQKLKASKIRTFIMNTTVSQDERLFNDQWNWLHLKKRASVQISGTDEKRRIDFFRQQRELVDTLPE
jgi:hypothetical protein